MLHFMSIMQSDRKKPIAHASKPAKARTILVVLRMTGASGRSLLEGVFQYVKRGIHWNIRLMQMPDLLTPAEIAACEREGIDGIITSELGTTPETVAALRDTSIPLAVISLPDPVLANRTAPTVFVSNDEEATGAQGVRFFRTLGAFNSFGFVQNFEGLIWSDLRAKGFCDEVAAFGAEAHVFRSPSPLNKPPVDSIADREALAQWLVDLPKPAAVMADWDYRGTQILEICNNLKIKVPTQVSVLGVDDDVLLCDFTTPALSSIKPDHEQVGYRAAAELDALLRSRHPRNGRTVRCAIKSIVERGSTKPLAPSAILVKKATDFIDRHACEGATVSDVVAAMGVSRSLADLRFREVNGTTILEALTTRRLNEVLRLLFTTDYPIKRISLSCGFSNIKHLKWLFHSRYGMSMREYRRRNGVDGQSDTE